MARQLELLQLFPILAAALFISTRAAAACSRFDPCCSDSRGMCIDGDLTSCSCMPFNSTICPNYSHSLWPNYRGQREMEDAEVEIKSFQELINSQCSKYLKAFLCFFYYPFCDCGSEQYSPVPCRDFCLAVRKECKRKIPNLKWPKHLSCRKNFPKKNCFDPRGVDAS